jgi:N-acetylmuramoyl-L-alanine amidase
MPEHIVVPGDCVASLAFDSGLLPETVWDHPKNAELKKRRGNRNILLPGDTIFIPEKQAKQESAQTDRRGRFVRKSVPTKLKLRSLESQRRGDPGQDPTGPCGDGGAERLIG